MPGQDGLWLLEQTQRLHQGLPVLILSMHVEEYKVIQALKAGARGYISKIASDEEFVAAIREVHAGGIYLQPQLAARVVTYSAEQATVPGWKSCDRTW